MRMAAFGCQIFNAHLFGEKIKFVDCSTPSCGSTRIRQLQKFDADELFDVIRSKGRSLEITEERF